MRTPLLCTVPLACLTLLTGPTLVSAQSLRDVVQESEGGRMPSSLERQHPVVGADVPSQERAPDVEPSPAAPEPPASSSRPTLAAVCVPPGLPAASELVSVDQQVLVAPVEGADEIVAINAIGLVTKDHLDGYRLGHTPLDFIVYFVHGHLAAVDDHPGDPAEPDLVDTGMVSPRGAARAQGRPTCQWARLPRTQEGGNGSGAPGSRI
jgi:hypothetical protein